MDNLTIKVVPLKDIEQNRGQLEGLPRNPRFIRDDKYERLKESISRMPEMLSLRELLVYPLPKAGRVQKYIVIGGNMRHRVLADLGEKEAVCKILPENTTIEQMKAYTVKDNAGFGAWDMDALANEWDTNLLGEWGLDVSFDDGLLDTDYSDKNQEIDTDLFEEDMELKISLEPDKLMWVKSKLNEVDAEDNAHALLVLAGWQGEEEVESDEMYAEDDLAF